MLRHLRRSAILAVISFVFFGFVYALAGTGLAQLLFRGQADGSVTKDGSALIEQTWTSPKFFHGRPDGQKPYALDNPLGSGGTNLGPRSKALVSDTEQLIAYWHKLGVNPTVDLVTTSGSGIDPDISPADAFVQIPMVSKATGIPPARLTQLIDAHIHTAQYGFLGSDYIDVLQLNEALAAIE